MFSKIKNFFWLLICESDEKYPDITRIGLLVSVIVSLAIAVYSVFFLMKDISFVDMCSGISALLFGGGTSIGLRAKLEDHFKDKKD